MEASLAGRRSRMAAVAVDAAVLVAVEVEVKEEPMARTRPSVCGLALAQEGRRVAGITGEWEIKGGREMRGNKLKKKG